MTTELSGFPYREALFDKRQRPLDPEQTADVAQWLTSQEITDLMVISHGWNNDNAEARHLYAELASRLSGVATVFDRFAGRTLGILGILWPAKRFADDDLIPGGAASVGVDPEDVNLRDHIESLHGFFDDESADEELALLASLVEELGHSPSARLRFFEHSRTLLGRAEDLDPDDRGEIPEVLLSATTEDEVADLFGELRKPDPPGTSTISASSGAASFGFGGFEAGARRLLNYFTYYQMKRRARKTGVESVAPMLRALRETRDELRLHLVGHSFGGLLVTSTAWGGETATPTLPVETMTLLQAAFSQHGFAEFADGSQGRYRSVLTEARVAGPTLVSHTRNDRAVGIAYALASRFAGQTAASLGVGGADDRFGGIGANGARRTPESIDGELLPPGSPYDFEPGRLYNLLADQHIDGHSDVVGEAVAHALVEAVVSPR